MLRRHDSVIPCILGHAYEMEFYESGNNVSEAKKAVAEYENAIYQGEYEFLRKEIERIKQDAGI